MSKHPTAEPESCDLGPMAGTFAGAVASGQSALRVALMVNPLRHRRETLRAAVVAAALLFLSTIPARADHWFATNVRGTVLMLVDDKWQDITAGQVLPATVVVRTLDNGQLTLAADGVGINLGGDAAVQLLEADSGVALTQYAGSLDVQADAGTAVTVQTPTGTVSFSAGSVQTMVDANGTRVAVTSGKARIAGASGKPIHVAAGQAVNVATNGAPTLEEPAQPPGEPTEDPVPAGEPPAGPPGTPPVDPPDPPDHANPNLPGGGGHPSSGGGGPPGNSNAGGNAGAGGNGSADDKGNGKGN